VNIVNDILPLNGELPCSFAERLGIHYSSQVSETHKKKQGQFFTPVEIARFMASLCNLKKPKIRILDPGCGTAILSCAMVEALISTNRNLSEIELVAYETDFRRILGTPAKEQQERASISRELHCLWKTDSLLINALFLVAPRTHEGKTYGKGSLLWFEVSRSL
jgi:N-6 DNA Methylase.